MATLRNPGLPRVKVDEAQDGPIKSEPADVDMPSPYMDGEDDELDEGGDLDFSYAQRQLWLTQIPKRLWESLEQVGGPDDEIEIGTLRVEGREENPSRVCLHGRCRCHIRVDANRTRRSV
jgi:transcription initiation factor TFIIF subunit beta